MLPRDPVAAVRRFNRFYTRRIGALDEAHLGSPYTLAEMRVLYEVAQAPDGITPKLLATRTGMDNGYLSRVLKRFETEALLTRQTSASDRRSVSVWLTSDGIHAYNRWLGSAQGAWLVVDGKRASKKVFLILDNLGVHHCKPVKAWLAEHQADIEVFYLPSYSPELNPDERLNADLKHVISTRVPVRTKAKLHAAATNHMAFIQTNPERVRSYFQDPRVKYAA